MLYDELKKANIEALKQRDSNKRAVLSVLLNKIKLAEIEKRTSGGELTEADVVTILQKSLKELNEEKEAFVRAGRDEMVKSLDGQIAFVETYLPKMMFADEIRQVIETLPDKSVPFVMKHFKSNYAGKCDMREVQTVLKSLNG